MGKAGNHCYREKTRNHTIISLKSFIPPNTAYINSLQEKNHHHSQKLSTIKMIQNTIRELYMEEGQDRFALSRVFLRALSALVLKGSRARGTVFSLAEHLHYFTPLCIRVPST